MSRETAQRAFVQRLQRQDTFGLAFYSATVRCNVMRTMYALGTKSFRVMYMYMYMNMYMYN